MRGWPVRDVGCTWGAHGARASVATLGKDQTGPRPLRLWWTGTTIRAHAESELLQDARKCKSSFSDRKRTGGPRRQGPGGGADGDRWRPRGRIRHNLPHFTLYVHSVGIASVIPQ